MFEKVTKYSTMTGYLQGLPLKMEPMGKLLMKNITKRDLLTVHGENGTTRERRNLSEHLRME